MFGLFKKKVRVRMAPSPTGKLHIGTARATLFNYLFAKKEGGTFILRLEDTDKARSKPEFEKDIVEGLTWLGLTWDEFYRQSERTPVYTAALRKLIDSGAAYVSPEPSKEDPSRTVEVVRLKNPNKKIVFTDLVRGEIETDTTDLGDFVIARSIDDPLYHLAVVVDDGEMGITHVIRSDDHIANTPRQILILEALGYARPTYVHQPLVLAPDRSKLSKRHGATALSDYRDLGFIPEGLVNYLAFLGWSPEGEQEVFTLKELTRLFDITKLHTSGAIFNMEKLLWFNREHMKRLSDEEFVSRLETFAPGCLPQNLHAKMLPLLRERASTLAEARDMTSSPEFSFLKGAPSYSPEKLIPRQKGGEGEVGRDMVKKHLEEALRLVSDIPGASFTAEAVKDAVWPYATAEGRGAVLWPMRYALSGADKSPDPFIIAGLIGKGETLSRLRTAVERI